VPLLNGQTYTVKREGSGSIGTDGRYQPGSISTFEIEANIQPADAQKLERLPERLRSNDTRVAYSPAELRTASAQDTETPDRVVIDGDDYEVQAVDRETDLIDDYRYLLVREQES